MIFKNRQDAGQKLATKLTEFSNQKDVIILALPRGGVVNAYEIAQQLNLPLDLVVPRKIGAPFNEEYAIGAITESGDGIFDQESIEALKVDSAYIDKTVALEKKEAQRRLKTYRQNRPPVDLTNKTVILVDDGIATGLTMRAAIKSIKGEKPKKIIVAVPVSAKDSLQIIKKEVDQVICLDTPIFFGAVAAFYKNFEQTEDKEVIDLMELAKDFGK